MDSVAVNSNFGHPSWRRLCWVDMAQMPEKQTSAVQTCSFRLTAGDEFLVVMPETSEGAGGGLRFAGCCEAWGELECEQQGSGVRTTDQLGA